MCILLILAQPKALEHVLEGCGVQVLLQVVESVLGHVRHTQVRVAPHSTSAGLVFAGDDLDQGLRGQQKEWPVSMKKHVVALR